jgi:hypothetical protein
MMSLTPHFPLSNRTSHHFSANMEYSESIHRHRCSQVDVFFSVKRPGVALPARSTYLDLVQCQRHSRVSWVRCMRFLRRQLEPLCATWGVV